MQIINRNNIDMQLLNNLVKKPNIFEESKTQEAFWDNDHISKQMLEAHLNVDWDAASRKADTIYRSCEWIVSSMNLNKDHKVIDLGCGPGLYCSKFAEYGLKVTGIDYSRRSIEYAKQEATRKKLSINYIYQNYLNINYDEEYDLALMIYCDFGVLSDESRNVILTKIHNALKKDGYFIFDIWTTSNEDLVSTYKDWSVNKDGGFWRTDSYVELIDKYYYKDVDVSLSQHVIISEDGEASVYNLWEKCFTVETISMLLEKFGFKIIGIYSDLIGTEYTENTGTLGIVAVKK